MSGSLTVAGLRISWSNTDFLIHTYVDPPPPTIIGGSPIASLVSLDRFFLACFFPAPFLLPVLMPGSGEVFVVSMLVLLYFGWVDGKDWFRVLSWKRNH